jgi:hypothetical protein
MQTVEWMSYSGSSHFSDKISYKILCILSYGFKDMNFARLKHFLEFFWKQRRPGTFLTLKTLAPQADERDLEVLTMQRLGAAAGTDGEGPHVSLWIRIKKGLGFDPKEIRTQDLQPLVIGTDQLDFEPDLSRTGPRTLKASQARTF